MKQNVFLPAEILLPRSGFEAWAVNACDQYTSQPEYWEQVRRRVADVPSAFHITLQEAFLTDDNTRRIARVNATMREYDRQGLFAEYPDSMVLVKRTTASGTRTGLVGMIDLEAYAYEKGAHSPIRATEETVVTRIPPRVTIRKDASLELPHVLLLMDDPKNTLWQAVGEPEQYPVLYDFDLMQQGGHLTGRLLTGAVLEAVDAALADLMTGQDPLLFAVGDGNHSLATAKECAARSTDPRARYALVEVVNLHDPAIRFEPIYRVLFGADAEDLLNQLAHALPAGEGDGHRITAVVGQREQTLYLKKTANLPVATLQPFLDEYVAAHPGVTMDYIHGTDTLRALCREKQGVGFLFDGMTKDQLFPAVRQDGSLPRKTFSMGAAEEKRFYMEARRLSAKE